MNFSIQAIEAWIYRSGTAHQQKVLALREEIGRAKTLIGVFSGGF
jgi:hypothetical protein